LGVDFESFQDVLKHPIRRKIIKTLNQTPNLSYMDLMGAVEASNTGKFNYHLKILADLIQKDESGKYSLTGKGHLAAEFLQTFKEKKVEPSPLRMADALLIGFTGFALTLANPGFWAFMQAAAMNIQSMPLLNAIEACTTIFALIVPGAVMWKMAVRRSHSHDFYDLYKAPFLAFAMLLSLLILMLVFHVNIGAQIAIQVASTVAGGNGTGPTGSQTTYSMTMMGLPQIMMSGILYAFLGVALSELVSRIRKRIKH
jgi:hypothetical protein